MPNRLSKETSPYLLQHANNPVDWYPWGEEALNLAQEQDKPILLSIGYSACHWCHVMAHESFESPEIAALMNRHFINIKVDREERPDIDQIYQAAHQMLSRRSGGWPLTVFLTPWQEPFFSGTYFPPVPRYQLPGFGDLLVQVAAFYHEHRPELAEQGHALMQDFARTVPPASPEISAGRETFRQCFEQLKDSFDFENGGFGGAPKFPNPADVTFLFRQAREGNRQAQGMALLMLEAMAAGGIYDQIGGGFCRYSVDERWVIPHFEKMLYDNGQLLCLYADGWQISRNPRFSQVIEETVMWMVREMRSADGAFYSSLDADSEGEEGRFYVWHKDEVRALLTPQEWPVASRCLGFGQPENFEGHAWHVYLAAKPDVDELMLLESARKKLFAAREKRIRPGLDNKILTGWNALAIKGLARVGRILNRHDWILLAQQAMDFVRINLWVNGKLLVTCRSGKAHLNAYLDDYAFLLDALLELMQAEYRPADMTFAVALADSLLAEFEAENGGFYFTSHHHETLIHRPKQPYDNATPSGNGIAAFVLQRLGHLLGEARYLQAAERTFKAFDIPMQHTPAACSSLLAALEEYAQPVAIVILRGGEEKLGQWREKISGIHLPDACIIYLPDDLEDLPQSLVRPAPEKDSGDVNAYLCRGVECLPVINQLEVLLGALQGLFKEG